nr:MAG TPA: hypothetical protein [Caudoviricetes sp.]
MSNHSNRKAKKITFPQFTTLLYHIFTILSSVFLLFVQIFSSYYIYSTKNLKLLLLF